MGWLVLLQVMVATVEQDPAFVEAVALYNDLEFEQSIFRLQDVALDDSYGDEDRALVFVWMGINYGQLGDLRAAERAFEQGLRRDPDILLPAPVPPTVEQRFFRARARVNETPPEPASPEPAGAVVVPEPGASGARPPPPANLVALSMGVGAAGALVVSLTCAAVAGYALVGALGQYQLAQSKQRTQRDAQERIAWANTGGMVAAAAGVIGVSALAGSIALVFGTVWLSGAE